MILRSLAQGLLGDPVAAQASLDEAERLAPNSAAPPMAAARAAYARGDLDLAAQKINRALELDPKRADAYLLKGQLLSRQGNNDGALDAFNAALSVQPKMIAARLERANLLVMQGQNDKAKIDIDGILADQPQATQGIYLKALLLARSGDFTGADVQFQRISTVLDRFPRASYFVALVKYNLGQVEQAVEAATHYVQREPADPDGPKLLARILLADGRGDRAIDVLSRAAKGGAADAETLDMLGRAYAIAGKSTEAVQSFNQASSLAPANSDILTRLATAKLGVGDTRGAAADLSRALTISPGQANTAEALVVAALASADIGAATQALATLRQQTGNTETVGLLNGQLLMMQQNLSGARAQFESLLAANDKLTRARFGLFQVLTQQGQPAEADRMLEDVIRTDPANVEALEVLLQHLLTQGKIAQAVALIETAHNAAPTSQPLVVVLAKLYLRANTPEKALALLAQAEKAGEKGATPASLAPLLAVRAQVQVALHQQPEARATLTRILAQSPADMPALQQMMALTAEAKDWEQARIALRQALIAKPGDPTLLRMLVSVDLQAGGEQAAFATIARLQADPLNREGARTLKADFALYTQHYLQAAELYAALLKATPSSTLVESTALAYGQAGQLGLARSTLQDWVSSHPADAGALGALGTLEMNDRQYGEAANKLAAALALQPNSGFLLNNLALVYQALHDPRALDAGRRAYLLQPSGQSADTLGWLLVSSGAAAEALPLLTRAADVLKDDPSVQFHLAAALKANGKPVEAIALLDPLVTRSPFDEQPQAKQMLAELKAAK